MKSEQIFLVVATAGLVPIALTYGADPGGILTPLFGFPVEGVNLTHIFRAVMGLYLALATLWLAGAALRRLRMPALWSLVTFMFGLAAGRALSLFLDGVPHPLLVIYFVLELAFGLIGLRMIMLAARRDAGP
jgi:hypothetical protein